MSDLVSVIIPTYNRRDMVCEAVDSVLAQTYRAVEIMVVDNASTDGTSRALSERYGGRVRVCASGERGVSRARNEGLRHARGAFVAFLDNDDLWESAKLERQMPLFRNPAVNVVYCDAYLFRRPRVPTVRYSSLYPPARGPALAPLFERSFLVCSTAVVRREALDRAGVFDPRYEIAEEYDLFLRLSALGEMDYVEEPLAWYRLHAGNDSHRRVRMWTETLELCQKADARHPELRREHGALRRRRFAQIHFHLGVSFGREGQWGPARRSLGEALRFGPGNVVKTALAWIVTAAKNRWGFLRPERRTVS